MYEYILSILREAYKQANDIQRKEIIEAANLIKTAAKKEIAVKPGIKEIQAKIRAMGINNKTIASEDKKLQENAKAIFGVTA